MKIEELLKMAEGLNLKEKFDPKDTKKPTESDLDDIYDAIQTLNKAEWFCTREAQMNTLVKAQSVLKEIKDNAEGLYDEEE